MERNYKRKGILTILKPEKAKIETFEVCVKEERYKFYRQDK